ncbi:MAG: pirin family protein [Propionibacterium sp.]|nr:pirin family protein [Propionibacterium sp.]
MTNQEKNPDEVECSATDDPAPLQVLTARDVPLGGLRAMTVRRTIPHRDVRMIGAWCFLDHYGPDRVADTGGMQVARHPHTGLSTVTWLFTGAVDHLDSAGNAARVVPGEVNLMTAGRGVTHSEFSTDDTDILHGAQLWLAAPEATRHDAPRFDHFRPEDTAIDGGVARVFLGEWLGAASPIDYPMPIVGAEIVLEAGARWAAPLNHEFEYGVLLDTGAVQVDGADLPAHGVAYSAPGRTSTTLLAGPEGARLLVIGGVPFEEKIVMWWNFIGRSHEEVVSFRQRYQAELGFEDHPIDGPEIFGPFPTGTPDPIPAPKLPNARLVSRN